MCTCVTGVCVPYEPNAKLPLERYKLCYSFNNRNTHKKKNKPKPKPKPTKQKNPVVMKKILMCNIRTCELKFRSELLSCVTVGFILFTMHKTKTI